MLLQWLISKVDIPISKALMIIKTQSECGSWGMSPKTTRSQYPRCWGWPTWWSITIVHPWDNHEIRGPKPWDAMIGTWTLNPTSRHVSPCLTSCKTLVSTNHAWTENTLSHGHLFDMGYISGDTGQSIQHLGFSWGIRKSSPRKTGVEPSN